MKNSNTIKTLLAAPLLALVLAVAPQHVALAQTTAPQKGGNKPYTFVEQMPAFKGGEGEMMKFLGSNIRYPKEAQENGVEGLVVVSFVVEKDGKLSEVQPVKKLGRGTDEEAMRVVQLMSGQWSPGKQSGETVRVKYVLPIRFALSEADRSAAADKANRPPQFKGGNETMMQAISSHLVLPAEAKQENLNARVMVKFSVEKDGSVSNVRLEGTKLKKIVGPGSELDYMDASTFGLQNKTVLAKLSEAAAAAVKSTSGQWEPALKDGQPIAAELVLPVQFLGSEANKKTQPLNPPSMEGYKKDYYKYDEVSIKPRLKDGSIEKFLAKNLRYPQNSTFEGDVDVHIIVKEDGKLISMIPVAVDKSVQEEVNRAVRLTKDNWVPGQLNGQPVTTARILKVRFVNNSSAVAATTNAKAADVVVTRSK
ncbi:TonB family protein [Pontibacter ruber]|uniref:TonB family protein n=1 Tax=Pontibacter ruber TaxID=1343895 RepID=A0ABW5CX48_9BACT|nr:TonB family protein [Pontibacter ruber]